MTTITGSPLAARQNPFVYLILLYALIIIAISIAIFLIIKIAQKAKLTPEYIQAQKTRITNLKDVTATARKIHLNKDEKILLWKLCKYTRAPNIFYNYADAKFLDENFKIYYQHKIRRNSDAKSIYDLFKLRYKIYKNVTFAKTISNSQNIPLETIFYYLAPSGFVYKFNLVKNEKNGLYATVPNSLTSENKDKPESLAKLTLNFAIKQNQQYAFNTRIIQYLNLPTGGLQVLLNHSNSLSPQNRRKSKRFEVNEKCFFSGVDVITEKNKKQFFTPKEKVYEGTIENISEGGCKLLSNLPIKKNQFIYLKISVKNFKDSFYGEIRDMRSCGEEGIFALHISFKNIPIETRIKLLPILYGYNEK